MTGPETPRAVDAPAEASLPHRLQTLRDQLTGLRLRFHDWLDVSLWAPNASYIEDVRDMFWPFAGDSSVSSPAFRVFICETSLPQETLAPFERQTVRLYNAHDGRIPDYDAGERVLGVPGVDSVVVNPATGGQHVFAHKDCYVLNPDGVQLRRDVWRLLKQLLFLSFETAGCYMIHASAVATDAGAIAFVGQRRAGKTTLMSAAFDAGARLRFLANDRLVLDVAPSGDAHVRGWSDPIKVLPAANANLDTKASLSLREFAQGDADRIETQRVPLVAVVRPQVGVSTAGPPFVRELDPGEALTDLRSQTLPERAKWTGFETSEPRPPVSLPLCRYFTISCTYDDAPLAIGELFGALSR